MVWKSIIFTFCLIKSWSHDQSECNEAMRQFMLQWSVLELSQTTAIELFCEIRLRVKAINYFPKKSPSLDVRLSYKYAFVAGLNSYKEIFQPCFHANPYYLSPVGLLAKFLRLLLGRGCFTEEASTIEQQMFFIENMSLMKLICVIFTLFLSSRHKLPRKYPPPSPPRHIEKCKPASLFSRFCGTLF